MLDNSVLIDKNFGSRKQIEFINSKLSGLDYSLYISKITLGEFIRSAIQTIIILINYIISRSKEIERYSTFNQFLDDITIDLPVFSLHEKDRILKITKLFKKRFNKFYDFYQRNEIPFSIALDSIIDDIIHFKEQWFKDITIIGNSYGCNDSHNLVNYNINSHEISFLNKLSCEVNSCKKKSFIYFSENYKDEIEIIKNAIERKEIKPNKTFLNAFDILGKIQDNEKIDGRKHYCYGLVDFFVIIECPIDFRIFTTNIKHFLKIAEKLNKKLL